MTRLLTLAALLLLTGCAPDLAALANDPAPICMDHTDPWTGSTRVNRYHGCDKP